MKTVLFVIVGISCNNKTAYIILFRSYSRIRNTVLME